MPILCKDTIMGYWMNLPLDFGLSCVRIIERLLNISSKLPLQNPDLSAYSERVFFSVGTVSSSAVTVLLRTDLIDSSCTKTWRTFVQGYKIKKVFFHYPNFRALPWPYYRESYYFFKLPPQNPNFCPYSEGIFQKHWFKPWHSDLLWGNI
jgi:hypothetical protein